MTSVKRESNNEKTYSNQTCTCGHHYGTIINNQSDMQSISSSRAVLPLDTSFVQIPYNLNAPSTATNAIQLGHHDTLHSTSKSPTVACSNQKLNLRGWNNNRNFEYINGVKKLYHTAIATSGRDLPSLCQRCVKRYEIDGIYHKSNLSLMCFIAL
jgi:hypothetical protein